MMKAGRHRPAAFRIPHVPSLGISTRAFDDHLLRGKRLRISSAGEGASNVSLDNTSDALERL